MTSRRLPASKNKNLELFIR